jgi:electron transport complex protein RnfB
MNIDNIDALLPQTQCTQCGYDDCRAYAEAISTGTPHNQCPPGGQRVVDALSQLLSRPTLSLNPDNGEHVPKVVAFVREDECIGCTKCIQACPVDAFVGAGKLMHTVISDECSGCNLCVEPCPVDCIDMIPAAVQPESLPTDERITLEAHYRMRHENRATRLVTLEKDEYDKHQANKTVQANKTASVKDKQAFISEAMARAQAKRR